MEKSGWKGDGCYKRGVGRVRIFEEDFFLVLFSLYLVVSGGEIKVLI